jgi:hypothetical protein
MQALRNAAFLARLVLAWFALSLGVAIASPVVNPQGVEVICSAGGAVKLMLKGDTGKTSDTRTLDCPLCAITGAPPVPDAGLTQAAPTGYEVAEIADAQPPQPRANAPPARGPPLQIAV